METGNVIIGLISILMIVVPFIFMYRNSKKTERGLMKNLKVYAEQHQFQIDESGAVAELALGIDRKNKIAFFITVNGDNYSTQHVDLSKIALSKVNREIREVDYHGEKDRITHRLMLDFYPKSKKDEVITFLLFDEDKERRLSGEIQLANQWVNFFNSAQ